MQQIDVSFKKERPKHIIKKRNMLLNFQAKAIAKSFLLSAARNFQVSYPEEKEICFVIKPIDKDLFFLYSLEARTKFSSLIAYKELKLSKLLSVLFSYKTLQIPDPIEVWNRVGKYAAKFGINECTILDRDDIYLFHVDYTLHSMFKDF